VESAVASQLFKRAKSLFGGEEVSPPLVVTPRKPVRKFHAVSIVPGPRACAAARELNGQRFLSGDAPPLPLKGCGSGNCECRYQHHEDRRKGGRRLHDLAVAFDGHFDGVEQRDKGRRGRRKGEGQ
jgi:hypothetical protein